MKKLYVIFVNFNSGRQLEDGVNAVLNFSSVKGIIIVDNDSKDKSMDFLDKIKETGKISVILNNGNVGFYKALNKGMKKAFELGADAIMPLDFDLDFSFDFVSKLLENEGDVIAPALKFKRNDRWFYDYGGRINWTLGYPNHLVTESPIRNIGAVSPSLNHNDQYWYDFVSGGCTIFYKRVIEKIGYFDEDYFVYFGDADYSIRARDAGFKVIMDGNTIVYHKQESARDSRNIAKLRISFFDNITFIRKRVKWYLRPLAYLHIILLSIKVALSVFT